MKISDLLAQILNFSYTYRHHRRIFSSKFYNCLLQNLSFVNFSLWNSSLKFMIPPWNFSLAMFLSNVWEDAWVWSETSVQRSGFGTPLPPPPLTIFHPDQQRPHLRLRWGGSTAKAPYSFITNSSPDAILTQYQT